MPDRVTTGIADMRESTCLMCGSANVLDGEPIPVVVQLEQEGVKALSFSLVKAS